MKQYVIVREAAPGLYQFIRDLEGDDVKDVYTEDLGDAEKFDETRAISERIDDEFLGVLKYDEFGRIEGYERVADEDTDLPQI